MHKWVMPMACHMFTHPPQRLRTNRIWWHWQKVGSIVNYEDLKAKFQSHFSQQKKFTKTHLAVHNIKQRKGESTKAFVTIYTDDTLQILGLHEDQFISCFVYGLKTRSLVEFLSTDLPNTYKGLMEKTYTLFEAKEMATYGALNDNKEVPISSTKVFHGTTTKERRRTRIETEKATKAFKPPPRMVRNRRSRDMFKYCYFHEDPGNEMNQYRELRHQTKEAMKSGQLAHLVKGLKKVKAKTSDTQLDE
ncbi:hypothetical protein Tco_1386014 [Tanacetum coccineum]